MTGGDRRARRSDLTVEPRRVVPFVGSPNFRDLGGYPTRSGARVRWRQVYRAGALDGFGPTDLALYHRLGLRTVFDLRTDAERDERPGVVPSRPLTIAGRPPGTEVTAPRIPLRTAADSERRLLEIYCGLIDHGAAQIGELFTALSFDAARPAVFHCHAGKDRTGTVAALLLESLGVERALVLDDYELTPRRLASDIHDSTFERLRTLGYGEEAAAAVLSTSRSAMEGALDHLDNRYGGIEPYLTGAAGMRTERLGSLRQHLLEG